MNSYAANIESQYKNKINNTQKQVHHNKKLISELERQEERILEQLKGTFKLEQKHVQMLAGMPAFSHCDVKSPFKGNRERSPNFSQT